jgi:predicted Zn-dependent peptidase
LGEYLVYCSCDDANAAEVQSVAMREMAGLTDSLAEDDLERIRSKIATDVTLHAELPAGRMRRLGRVWTYTGGYRSLDEELARINAVTLNDLRAVSEAFPIRPLAIGHLTGAEA